MYRKALSISILALTVVLAGTTAAQAQLIIHEGFDYPIGTVGPDPDGGLNANNGLPATNSGGNPSGTGTGMRGTYGSMIKVQAGLTYSQSLGTKVLKTSGGSANVTNNNWGADIFVYRNMVTDPFSAFRTPGSSEFGADGKTLYVSMLMRLGDNWIPGTQAAVKFGNSPNTNVFFGVNTGGGAAANTFSIAAQNTAFFIGKSSGVVASAGMTALLVLRYSFGVGNEDTADFFVDPELGAPLGTPMATLSVSEIPAAVTNGRTFGFSNFNTRPNLANALTFDELRIGTTFESVTPLDTGTTTVNGQVTLNDFTSGDPATIPVYVEIRAPGSTTALETHPVTLAADGTFSFDTALAAGTYDISVKASHWLRKTLGSVALTGPVEVALINGDIDGDNSVTVFDYDALSTGFDSTAGGAGWNVEADLDGDGAVTVFDYDILSTNFDLTGNE